MAAVVYIFIFLFGLIVGSFINALQYRIQEEKSIGGRSFCPKCKKEIAWYDLFPVISWVILGGKCRNCKKEISAQYPLIELITGLSFVLISQASGFVESINGYIFSAVVVSQKSFWIAAISLLLTLIVVGIFVLLALHDAKTTYVLSAYVYVGVILSLAIVMLGYSGSVFSLNFVQYLSPYLYSAILPALFFFAIYYFSKGKWMGAGDSELAFLIGFFVGYPNVIVAFYSAFIIASIWGLAKVYIAKNAELKSQLAFGPFLITGAFIGYVFGEQLINIYVKIFLGA